MISKVPSHVSEAAVSWVLFRFVVVFFLFLKGRQVVSQTSGGQQDAVPLGPAILE